LKDKRLRKPFLMHRVELKGPRLGLSLLNLPLFVPNAPCGVESQVSQSPPEAEESVPNAPCGVESKKTKVDVELSPIVCS
jgi:hypothetical protein